MKTMILGLLLAAAPCFAQFGTDQWKKNPDGSISPKGGKITESTEIATPTNPPSGFVKYYGKGGKLCSLSSAGAEVCTGGASGGDALNLLGGSAGQVPYQSGAGATAFSSAFSYNNTTKVLGLVGGFTAGQPGTLAGTYAINGLTSGTITIKGADAAGTWTLTLPTSGGTNGQVLSTNGSGGTNWIDAAAGTSFAGCTASGPNGITCTGPIVASGFSTPASSVANMSALIQGTAATPPANSVGFQAPASVPSAYLITLPAAPAAGFVRRTNATPSVESVGVLASGDIPNNAANTSGSAATLTTPRAIYGNNFDGSAALTQVIGSAYGGTGNGFTKFSGPVTAEKTFALPNASATLSYTVFAGTLTLNTTSIAANTCVTVVAGSTNSVAATGVLTTDTIEWTPNGSIKAAVGFRPADTVSVVLYPTAGYINADACNLSATTATGTLGAVTFNVKVVR